jgi:aldehyde:ferredoxin oxidoreductase
MAKGYNGKMLRVDLSTRMITVEHPLDSFYRTYGGGSAMGTYYQLKKSRAGAEPFGPDNVLSVFVGPATGAPGSGQSRVAITARSPLSGAIGDAQAGGFWPAAFERTGFDGIVVTGQADGPVYLWVSDGKAELRDAQHLWGKITGEVEDSLKEELADKNIEVMQIGPAGERLVRYASVINIATGPTVDAAWAPSWDPRK